MFEKRLQLTTAAYQITKDNVAVTDPDHSGFNVNGGTLRSEGFDVDVLGQITREWQIVGCYSHTDTRVIESTSLPVGASFINVPDNSGSLWLKYTLQDGPLNGLGGGVGCFAAENSAGDGKNSFDLPGYTRWDTGVWYTYSFHGGCQLKVQVNLLNVFDKTYYESSGSTAQVEPGYPRYVMTRVSLTF
jgi:iron complex outermembrane receptor protein